MNLSEKELLKLNSSKALKKMLKKKKIKIKKILRDLEYEEELKKLQVEMVKLQKWAMDEQKKIAIFFEGRDAAGKGGTILRFTQHLRPREKRIVALPKPTDAERGQWYFQRYVTQLPSPGEMVFFDRSWYNRAVVEPVMGFCSEEQYYRFMQQVNALEQMLCEEGLILVKFWFTISQEEQAQRFEERRNNPLKHWKLSPVDEQAQQKWDEFTDYKNRMLAQTHTGHAPWIVVEANDKRKARIESMRYLLSKIEYVGKENTQISLEYDPLVVSPFQYESKQID